MSDSTYVDVHTEDAVAWIRLDGTGPMNTLNQETVDSLCESLVGVGADNDVRCIVLTGAGDCFSAGADLRQFDGDEGDETKFRKLASRFHDAIVHLHQAEKPVVTGINGVAAGAGFSLALVGDVALLSEDARLVYSYSRSGLTGDGGVTFFLPRLVGLRKAKEIALFDEPIESDEAVELGLVTEAVPASEFTARLDKVASQLASGPTKTFAATQRLMTESFGRSLTSQLAAETDGMGKATRTEDYARGLTAFLNDSEPEFTGQ